MISAFIHHIFRAACFLTCFLFFESKIFAQGDSLRSFPVALHGTVVTPEQVLPNGWVLISGGKITAIYSSNSHINFPPNTIQVETKGIILPGMVDVHNHIAYNVFGRWNVGPLKFNNRYAWRYHSPQHKETVSDPYNMIKSDYGCEINTYGEIRALVGGTTSILSGGSGCMKGLIRNLGDPQQVDQRRIEYLIDIKNHDTTKSNEAVENLVDKASSDLAEGKLDAFFIHLAEGKSTDPVTIREFYQLEQKKMLGPKTSIIHGISFRAKEFAAMKKTGTSLVWSPRSNMELYGETADILAARRNNISIALAPDWAVTGSNSMLEELKYAFEWNRQFTRSFLSTRDLFNMVTSIPATMAGVGDKLGSIREGYFADLLVIEGSSADPFRSLVDAKATDIRLVMVNGTALYGQKPLMEKFYEAGRLEVLYHSTPAMVIRKPLNSSISSFTGLRDLLSSIMAVQNVKLAPVFDVVIYKEISKPVINQ